jgi:hypothetical protein
VLVLTTYDTEDILRAVEAASRHPSARPHDLRHR